MSCCNMEWYLKGLYSQEKDAGIHGVAPNSLENMEVYLKAYIGFSVHLHVFQHLYMLLCTP